MPEQSPTIDRSLLLEQSGWVLRLAHNLVRDPYGADDVAQETLLAALAAPPGDAADARRLRAWLGRVAFNLAHLATRRSMRRRAREEDVARGENLGSAADHVVRASVLAGVSDAVDQLAEPYRTAVRLRYFEGLTTADIARRTETTESAVRKRLWRARGQLRITLDGRHGGERQAWFEALAPLALTTGAAERAATTASRIGFAKGGFTLAAAAASIVVGISLFRDEAPSTAVIATLPIAHAGVSYDAPAAGGRSGARIQAPVGSVDEARDLQGDARRTEVREVRTPTRVDEGTSRSSADGTVDVEHVRGNVIDPWGNALGGAVVFAAAEPNVELARTSSDGCFSFPPERLPVTLHARVAGYGMIRPADVGAGREAWEQWIVAAPVVALGGTVVDTLGHPVEGAVLEVAFDERAFVSLPVRLAPESFTSSRATSNAHGVFDLGDVPTGRGIAVRVRHPAFEDAQVAVPGFARDDWALVLRRTERRRHPIAGIVTDAVGAPVRGATVALGDARTTTSAIGAFQLFVRADQAGGELVASKPGLGRASAERSRKLVSKKFATAVHLTLEGVQASITGSIQGTDEDGAGGWVVFASLEGVEGVAPLEGVPAAEDGEFTLDGALGASYAVFAVHGDTQASTWVASAIGGDTGIELQSGAHEASSRLRFVDSTGQALAGVSAVVSLGVAGSAYGDGGIAAGAVSDQAGEMELPAYSAFGRVRVAHPQLGEIAVFHGTRNVPGRLGRVSHSSVDTAQAASAEPTSSGLSPAATEVRLDLPAGLSLESTFATAFELVDAAGNAGPRSTLVEGRSGVVLVDPDAVEIRWFGGDAEVAREPVRLEPGALLSIPQR